MEELSVSASNGRKRKRGRRVWDEKHNLDELGAPGLKMQGVGGQGVGAPEPGSFFTLLRLLVMHFE
jgi:hypothetical protein